MNIPKLVFVLAFAGFAANSLGQAKKYQIKTEVLEYMSAVYDPISSEVHVEFKNANSETRIFYHSNTDTVKLEEKFFNSPVAPITEAGKNLTKTELVGKKYKIEYSALTESATSTCCFKMSICEGLSK